MTVKITIGTRIVECEIAVRGAHTYLRPLRDCGAFVKFERPTLPVSTPASDSLAVKYAKLPKKGWLKVRTDYLPTITAEGV
jgi:hypothetical protein